MEKEDIGLQSLRDATGLAHLCFDEDGQCVLRVDEQFLVLIFRKGSNCWSVAVTIAELVDHEDSRTLLGCLSLNFQLLLEAQCALTVDPAGRLLLLAQVWDLESGDPQRAPEWLESLLHVAQSIQSEFDALRDRSEPTGCVETLERVA